MAINSFCFCPPDSFTKGLPAISAEIEAQFPGHPAHAPGFGRADAAGEIDKVGDRHFQRRRQLRHKTDPAQHV